MRKQTRSVCGPGNDTSRPYDRLLHWQGHHNVCKSLLWCSNFFRIRLRHCDYRSSAANQEIENQSTITGAARVAGCRTTAGRTHAVPPRYGQQTDGGDGTRKGGSNGRPPPVPIYVSTFEDPTMQLGIGGGSFDHDVFDSGDGHDNESISSGGGDFKRRSGSIAACRSSTASDADFVAKSRRAGSEPRRSVRSACDSSRFSEGAFARAHRYSGSAAKACSEPPGTKCRQWWQHRRQRPKPDEVATSFHR